MKPLMSLACLGVLCLLLSSTQVHAQVSRKGGNDQPKIVLKKDKKEPASTATEARNERTRTETSGDRTSTSSRRETGGRTYPDRRHDTQTRERRLPETKPRYPYPTGNREVKRDRQDRDEPACSRAYGHFEDGHHPGKGRHLGWHKHKHKGKGKGGKRH